MPCVGCGGQVFTGGCINPDCAQSLGGTYVNGAKVRTASGRPLVPDNSGDLLTCIACGTKGYGIGFAHECSAVWGPKASQHLYKLYADHEYANGRKPDPWQFIDAIRRHLTA